MAEWGNALERDWESADGTRGLNMGCLRSAGCLYSGCSAAGGAKLAPMIHAFLVAVCGDGGADAGGDQRRCGDQEADGGPSALEVHRIPPSSSRKVRASCIANMS